MYKLPTCQQLIDAGMPYGKNSGGYPKGNETTEWLRTDPDAVVYVPTHPYESGNEIVQVVEVPGKDCLFAVWNQGTREGALDTRMVYSCSKDGQIWSEPRFLAGVHPGMAGKEAYTRLPCSIASPDGRIYVFYIQAIQDTLSQFDDAGIFMCQYTDDCGETWSEPTEIPWPKTPWFTTESGPARCMFPMQNPIRMQDGRYCAWFTQAVPSEVIPRKNLGGYVVPDCRIYFSVFENIADSPDPEDFCITWLPDDPKGLCLQPEDPPYSAAEEPFVVQLPNGWLFTVIRNFKGFIYYTVSEDLGHTWREPKIMRFADGEPFVNPAATPFLCDYGNGEYIQLYYGRGLAYERLCDFREHVYRVVGTFAPEEEQPIRFAEKGELYMSGDVMVGFRDCAPEVSLEASFTRFHGEPMIWYGDRKHYVLGKKL